MDYFPLTTAKGAAFCNRVQELKLLHRNITEVRPTLIMSTRRYGKTSLALKALENTKSIYATIDFYRDLNEEHIERSIMNGIGALLGKMESAPQKLMQLASQLFSGMQASLTMSEMEIAVQFQEKKKRASDNIINALKRLHDLAQKRKQNVVLFFDEFQQLSEATNDHSIEAALREAAQSSTQVSYLFSGSNRHLLQNIFFDQNRPFYKLCDFIQLERIHSEAYIPYLQHAACDYWKKELSQEVLETIVELTERHPYYINLLCSKIWLDDFPTEKKIVRNYWEKCALENKSQIQNELSLLSLNQRKLIIALAMHGPVTAPNGTDFMKKVNLPQTSLLQALSVLIEKDYVYQDSEKQYRLLDPLIRYLLSEAV
ncbi:MAG: hypothetical protein A3F17_06880 [Gammaproteobacteria bacterium RIFCSPHIGHO2_12_FULL_41_15]|nr:MAG: hypothetical protein A3F17_06880 [Gammaproteobacteria bacterium RIFCSPHIGHO2_12_FULL_41_15]